ncbi:MAG: 16S rRNA (guanine(527)-N(7))-methyltransferase RsmG [Clostridia bacterium]|nr:16S rRNA (guanine(527)-N(7))-methyltransferase RsmG [Clostridia bacterium]
MNVTEQEFTSLFTKIFSMNGLSSLISKDTVGAFYKLTDRMLTENEKYNLTAITDIDKIILNHYADCAMIASKIKKGASIIDVGCGAGFPTLPLAIVRPDVKITAVDSTAKRVNYVTETAEQLSLLNVTSVVARAEDLSRTELRESFDYATARAVAELRVLTELCLPFVKKGGKMLAMKGKNAEFELSGAKRAISMLGGRGAVCEQIKLVGVGQEQTHPLIIIDKAEKTPAAYPRPYAQISKKPL